MCEMVGVYIEDGKGQNDAVAWYRNLGGKLRNDKVESLMTEK